MVILSVHAFSENQTLELGVGSMLKTADDFCLLTTCTKGRTQLWIRIRSWSWTKVTNYQPTRTPEQPQSNMLKATQNNLATI